MSIINNKVGGIFIPVSDINRAREWYCTLLNLKPTYEIFFDHLCCIPLDNNGLNIILDSKIFTKEPVARFPMFHFNTEDIHEAFQFLKDKEVEIVTEIENGHYFNIKDPDGNLLMICKC